jgi:hypothetical protein
MPRLLATYLNDHLALSTVELELVGRARGSNDGSELGDFLARLAAELEADRKALEDVMEAVGAGKDRLKLGGAWAGEKVGRLKLNGRWRGYSPLSRVVELEGLQMVGASKASLWRMLRELLDPRLSPFDFDALIVRAERQHDELEQRRLEAGRIALASD